MRHVEEVEVNHIPRVLRFGDLDIGEGFYIQDKAYIKTRAFNHEEANLRYNTMNLKEGTFVFMTPDTVVDPYKEPLLIKADREEP